MTEHEQITAPVSRCVNRLRAVPAIFCLPIIAIAITLVASTSAAAQNIVRLDVLGGPGGNYFEHICGPARVLVGVRGYTGVWIDNVQAVCAKVEANGVSDAQPEGPIFGGNRPINTGFNCLGGTVAAGLWVERNRDHPYLGLIRPMCADFFTRTFQDLGRLDGRGMQGTGRLLYPAQQECAPGTVAVGIRGRASQFVDALGVICGPKPAPRPETGRAGRPIGKLKVAEKAQAARRVGKVKLGQSRPETVGIPSQPSPSVPTPAPNPTPPFIIANPAVVVIAAGHTQGTAALTWDGGQAHPFAEVWVKVDDTNETFIVEQNKGTRQVTIELGKTYLFILTDAGQRLATVNVTAKN